MTFRLNPDGAKIKSLRIQRGWTQEQLAEIAGVSARTIQRAESAGSAAFDTLRAVAGAFETEFRELIKPDPLNVEDLKPQPVSPPAPVVSSTLEPCDSVTPSDPVRPVRGTWKLPPAAVATLAAGLLVGGIIVYWLIRPVDVIVSTPGQNPVVPALDGERNVTHHTEASTSLDAGVQRRIEVLPIRKAVNGRKSTSAADKSEDRNLVGQTPQIFQPAVLATQTSILTSEPSTPPELPLQPRGSNATPAVPWMSDAKNPPLFPGESLKDDSGVGAVRGAMGLATRKTGDAFARVGASMKRAF